MALRRRSIRLKILLLILVPLVSLIGLYAFVAGITIGDATKAARTPSLRNNAGQPVLLFLQQLEGERRLAALYSASPSAAVHGQLIAQEAKTDQFRKAMEAGLRSSATSGNAGKDQKATIVALLHDGPGLSSIRAKVNGGNVSPLDAVNSYGKLISDINLYMTRLAQRVSAQVQLQAYSLYQQIASLELLAQEDAIIEADLAAGSLPDADRAQFIGLVSMRRQFADDAQRNLGPNELTVYSKYVNPKASAGLQSLEEQIIDDPHHGGPVAVDPAAWGQSVLGLTKGMGALVQAAAVDVSNQGSAVADDAYLRLGLAGGLGLLALVASVFISIRVGRSLVRQLGVLRDSALSLATERLPGVISRLRSGEDVDVSAESPSMEVSPDEIGKVGEAFNTVQRTAVEAAVDQARLRRGFADVFRNLARRSQSLLHRQLTLLDAMERRTSDPDELADLYRLDHLTTRMRRHAEGLIILSGAPVGRSWRNPVRLVDVMRGAVAEVEDYTRVSVSARTEASLAGQAVADTIHMIAELVENATLFSPPNTPVRVAGDVVGNGFAVEIEDRGLGMSEDKLDEINHRLANPPEFTLADSDQLGLFVAGRLAQRHGIKIAMRNNAFGGSTAIVLIPRSLVVPNESGDSFGGAVDTGSLPVVTGRHVGDEPPAPSNGRTAVPEPPYPTMSTASAAGPADGLDSPPLPSPDPLLFRPADSSAGPAPGNDAWADFSAPGNGGPDEAEGAGELGLLPRRVRQASLAPQLRTATPPGPAVGDQDADYRSPEQTRSLVSSLQRGWERGRSEPENGANTNDGENGGQ
jgi:signal transduction histidine kinase